MRKITVGLGERSYPIIIGSGLDCGALVREALPGITDIMVVTNDTVGPLYARGVRKSLERRGFKVRECVLRDGEAYKTVDSWMQILTALLECGFGRDCAVAALGGGVVGDMAGFAAACYQRGVPFAQIPTTLLAMVDSSVGGKTAFNHPLGKNMIGAFYQPETVVMDLDALKTLPERELSAGMGEVIKTGVIRDAGFFAYLEEHASRILACDEEAAAAAIQRCCEIKAEVVSSDERERGLRAILNLGHTFGHALEAYLGFGTWLHGEAVGLGLVIAAALAVRRSLMTPDEEERVRNLVRQCGLPTVIPGNMSGGDFIAHMRHDKKVRGGVIRYVLPQGLGSAGVYADVTDAEVTELIAGLKARG